jgi:hypothetical protein
MVDDTHEAEPVAEQSRRRLMVGQLVTNDAQDGVYFARLAGSRRVEVDGHELFAEFGVAQGVRAELALSPNATAERPHLETRHAQDQASSFEEMLGKGFVARVQGVGHGKKDSMFVVELRMHYHVS